MYRTPVNGTPNTREMTSSFYGLNRQDVIADGEFSDTYNMSADHFPVLAPRKPRKLHLRVSSVPWNLIETEWHRFFKGEVTHAYAHSDTTIEVDGEKTLSAEFSVNSDLVKNAEVSVSCYFEDASTWNERFVGGEDTEYTVEFTTPKKCDRVEISLIANIRSGVVVDYDEVDTIITNEKIQYASDHIRGMNIKDGKLCYLIGQYFYYDGTEYDLTEYIPEGSQTDQQLLTYGSDILIFPAGIYFNTITREYGSLGNKIVLSSEAVFQLCDINGNAIEPTVAESAPENPQNGEYWISTLNSERGLYQWNESFSMWQPIATSYILIRTTEELTGFEEGDAVYMNSPISDINNGSIIQRMGISGGFHYMIITGLIEASVTMDTGLSIERPVPLLDYVCISNNRVWGCRYGRESDTIINEIRASKLGDPRNWNVFAGNANDSFTLSIGSDGEFTGAFTYDGYPYFFKENVVYSIYGGYPAAYSLNTYDCRGVAKGCFRTIAKVNEYLMYKSPADVCIFNGSYPRGVSDELGLEEYTVAAAGACLDKYYISIFNNTRGEWELLTYDIKKGLWMKEDDLHINEFEYTNAGQLYGQNLLEIYGFGKAEDNLSIKEQNAEDNVAWFVQTGDYGFEYTERKYLDRITIRCRIPVDAGIAVFMSYDDGPYKQVNVLRGDSTLHSQNFSIKPRKCDHYRMRFEGRGDCRIYSITRTFEIGEEKNGYKRR